MVLSQTDIKAEFPLLELDMEESGYQDNDDAAEATVNPDDTGADLAAMGRLDGYVLSYFDLEALFVDDPSVARPFALSASVDLFESPQAAQAFIQLQIEDYDRLAGSAIEEGVILTGFETSVAPDVGTDAVAGRYGLSILDFDLQLTNTLAHISHINSTGSIVISNRTT